MAERNTVATNKRKPKLSGGTPRRGDRSKLARNKSGKDLIENDPPADLEPDGVRPGTNPTYSNRYTALDANDDDEDDEDDEDEDDAKLIYKDPNAVNDPIDDFQDRVGSPSTTLATVYPPVTAQEDHDEDMTSPFTTVTSRPRRHSPPTSSSPKNKTAKPKKNPRKNTEKEIAASNEVDHFALFNKKRETPLLRPDPHQEESSITRRQEQEDNDNYYTDSSSEGKNYEDTKNDVDMMDTISDSSDDEYFPTLDTEFGRDANVAGTVTTDEITQLILERDIDLDLITFDIQHPSDDDDSIHSVPAPYQPIATRTFSPDSVDLNLIPPPSMSRPNITPTDIARTRLNTPQDSTSFSPSSYLAAANSPKGAPTPTPLAHHLDPSYSMRYGLRIVVPPALKPKLLETLAYALTTVLAEVQSMTNPQVGIGAWDHRYKDKTIKLPQDIPDHKNAPKFKESFQRYFDHFIRINKKEDSEKYIVFAKIRFVTSTPNTMVWPLATLGEHVSSILESHCTDELQMSKIILSPRPFPCQAAKVTTIGWLFGSIKQMSERTLLPAIKHHLKIPPEVLMGISWRVMRNAKKRLPPYTDDGVIHPQALHIDIDELHHNKYSILMAQLWKKHSKPFVHGLNLRLIPCFTSPRMQVIATNVTNDVLRMASKQQFFVTEYATRLPTCHFITCLDVPATAQPTHLKNDEWTLRRFLMKAAPVGFPSHRLFLTVDESWDGKGHVLYTIAPFYDEAARSLNNMIPECFHLFGKHASKWFTNEGIASCADIVFVPGANTSLSTNTDILECVDEDFLGMKEQWIKKVAESSRQKAALLSPAVLNPGVPITTAADVLNQRIANVARTDQSVASFGDCVFERDHDGLTVKTTLPSEADQGLTSLLTPRVQIDLTGMDIDDTEIERCDDDTISMSTMAKTTESTRQTLKSTKKKLSSLEQENELQSRLREESEQLAESLKQQLASVMAQMEALKASTKKPKKQVTLSTPFKADDPPAGAALRGAGHDS